MATPLRVLILEDRPEDAELIVDGLQRAGFELEWRRVENEPDYLSELTTLPDIILADHTLPQFGAPQALEILKGRGLDIPFIVVTESISEEAAVERMKEGAADYILKDRMARLGPAVLRVLEEKRLRDEKRQTDATLQARHGELQTLQEISQTLLASSDLKTALQVVLAKAMSVGCFDIGTILLLNRERDAIEAVVSAGYRDDKNARRKAYLRSGTGEEGHHRGLMQTRVEQDIESGKGGLRTLKREGVQSAIVAPARAETEVFGILQLGRRKPRKFSPSEIRFVESISNLVGLAAQRAWFQEESKHNLDRIQALHEIDLAIGSSLDLHAVLTILLEKIDLFLPYSAAVVRLFDRETGDLQTVACWNIREETLKDGRWREREGLARVAIANKAPVMVRNALTDPRVQDPDFFRKNGLVSYLVVPLIVKDEPLGITSFFTKDEHEFSSEEIEFLTTLASQAAIAIHNSQLYEETKTQAQDLAKANTELERANKVKDEFLSVMSHELRTPLNVVMGYAGMIKDGALGEINPKQEEAVAKILARTKEQLDMVNNILHTTVLEAAGLTVDRQVVLLPEFLNELMSIYFELSSRRKDFTVTCVPPDLPVMEVDGTKLKIILQNLINNAVKFTEKGRVTVSARELPEGREVEFRVADTGIGIPKDELPSIFEKFRQVDSSDTRLYGGVGLGLYIAKRFAELLGGKIEIESEPGKGSTFIVTLPIGTSH